MSLRPKDHFLNIVNDIELISKEIFEFFLSPKHIRHNLIDCKQLADLLVKKDHELKSTMIDAQEQELIQAKIDQLRQEVQDHDDELQKLQQSFKEAESVLATAIYQAKNKLSLIKQAQVNPIYVDELIKYAHKISSDYSVASPHNWGIGDQRRPYPTDIEMKSGFLIKSNDNLASLSNLMQQQQNQQQQQQQESAMMSRPSASSSSPYSWAQQQQQQGPYQSEMKPLNPMMNYEQFDNMKAVSVKQQDNDDVEVMSTDSSSTSSSDSQ